MEDCPSVRLSICPRKVVYSYPDVYVWSTGGRPRKKQRDDSREPVGGPLRAYKVPSRLVGVIRFGRCQEALKGLRTWLAWMGDSHMDAGGNNAPFGCGDDRGLEDFEEGSGAEVGKLCRRDADVCGVVEAYSKPYSPSVGLVPCSWAWATGC